MKCSECGYELPRQASKESTNVYSSTYYSSGTVHVTCTACATLHVIIVDPVRRIGKDKDDSLN